MNTMRNMTLKDSFSTARTPQQNGVVERKNRIMQEMARTMLKESKVANIFWKESCHTKVHILNRCLLRPNEIKIPF